MDSILSQDEIKALLQIEGTGGGEKKDPDQQQEGKAVISAEKALEARRVAFNRIEPNQIKGRNAGIDDFKEINFSLQIVLGRAVLTVKDILNLTEGSVIVLDRMAGENADLLVNGTSFAEGEIVVLNDCFAFRFSHLGENDIEIDKGQPEEEGRDQ